MPFHSLSSVSRCVTSGCSLTVDHTQGGTHHLPRPARATWQQHTSARTPRAPLSLVGMVAAAAAAGGVGCSALPGPAGAATKRNARSYPAPVASVLEHLQQRPMTPSSQAMQYDAQPTVPLPACAQAVADDPSVVLPRDVGDAARGTAEAAHFSRVIAGALLVACGGLDAAHNLVTPLCWGSWTPYAGNPVRGSAAAAEAAYVHALIHRQEGACDGEFGSGWSNANYWYRAAGAAGMPFAPALLEEAQQLAAGSPELEQHVAAYGGQWQPSRFVDLCSRCPPATASAAAPSPSSAKGGQGEGSGIAASGGGGDARSQTRRFCEGVMAAELSLLLDHCYARLRDQGMGGATRAT